MEQMLIEDDLIIDEGMVLKPYRCSSGKLTIGVGRNIEDVGISEDEARYLLRNDIRNCIADLNSMNIYRTDLSLNRWCVLVNMRFNLGPNRFRQFKKMLSAIYLKDFEKAADEMVNSKWYV
jgi:lysozyme